MSIFVMEPRALAVLAEGVEKTLNMGYTYMGMDAPESLRDALKDCADRYGFFSRSKIFARLYALNYAAFADRYDGRHLEATDETPDTPDIPDQLHRAEYAGGHHTIESLHYRFAKLVECYLYQCEEGQIPSDPLYKGMEDFQRGWFGFIVRNSEGYTAAPWGEF